MFTLDYRDEDWVENLIDKYDALKIKHAKLKQLIVDNPLGHAEDCNKIMAWHDPSDPNEPEHWQPCNCALAEVFKELDPDPNEQKS
jgi:hypothetical protein